MQETQEATSRHNAEAARAAHKGRFALARLDCNTFTELVMRDESTGRNVVQAPCHEAWHEAADDHDRLVLFAHVESGKTNQLTIARTLWELGRNPNLRIAIVSNTYHQAEKCVGAVASYIETSDMLHAIFPDLRPGEPWTRSQVTVKSDVVKKDPSLQAVGVHGNILGARLDLVILDDILDFENTLTPRQRRDLWDWYHATLAGRLTEHARVLAIGTAWHPEDILHRWERTDGWKALRFPVVDEAGNPTWPERWSRDRIDAKRVELGPLEFARQMLCKARDDAESRFKQEWIERCLENGDGCLLSDSARDFFRKHPEDAPPWWDDEGTEAEEAREALGRLLASDHDGRFFTGVDLAVQRHAAADETVLFTIYARKDGRRQVVDLQAGKWTGPEIVQRIVNTYTRFGSIVVVENNSAQDFILQFVREHGVTVPLLPFTTGKNKAHPEFGVESIAAEFAAVEML